MILLIEDADDSSLIVRRALEPEHTVLGVSNLSQAREALAHHQIDLILLDVVLPDGNGFEFLASLKHTPALRQTPVLFITAKASVSDQVLGFSLGAEDYLSKPIHPLLLQARVSAKLKKFQELKNQGDLFVLGDLKFIVPKQRVFIVKENKDEAEVELTPLEFRLLLHLARHDEQIFTRDQLINVARGERVHVLDRTIDTHISHLRIKLAGSSYTLDAVRGTGYRLIRREQVTGKVKRPAHSAKGRK